MKGEFSFKPRLSTYWKELYPTKKVGDRFGLVGWGVVVREGKSSLDVCNSQITADCKSCEMLDCPIKKNQEE